MTRALDNTPPGALADVQGQPDSRGVALDRVGVTGLKYPLTIRQKDGRHQVVTADADLTVGLHDRQRGAHLSSLVEALHHYRQQPLGLDELVRFAEDIRLRQDERGLAFDKAGIRVRFTYFLEKAAPVSGLRALVPYDCGYQVVLDGSGFKSTSVSVPVTTLCPCSLEISDQGAHNQRALVSIQLSQNLADGRVCWCEELIELAEGCASSAVHSLLKRADEKAVTEAMFRTPRFAEDIVRDAVVCLRRDWGGADIRYSVRCEAFESIHPHNAYAEANGAC